MDLCMCKFPYLWMFVGYSTFSFGEYSSFYTVDLRKKIFLMDFVMFTHSTHCVWSAE